MAIKRRELLHGMAGLVVAIATPLFLGLAKVKKSVRLSSRTPITPFFLGWYSNMQYQFAPQIANRGINLILPYVGNSDRAAIQSYLNKARKLGVKVAVSMDKPLVESGDIPAILDFIRAHKNHPAVAVWYLYDEPEYTKPNPFDPNLLKNIYQAIQRESSSIPVAVACNEVKTMEAYTSALDILMWDEYPCRTELAEFAWAPTYRQQLQTVARIAKRQKKSFWSVLQAYEGNNTNLRLPTKGELRYMFYSSVVAGAESLLFWMIPLSKPAWNESILYPIIAEFREYISVISNGGKLVNLAPEVASNLEIKIYYFSITNKVLAIAINHSQNKTISTVKIDRKLAGKNVTVNRQRIMPLSPQGNLTIVLQPYEVRMYEIG